jgi:uncharacterized membrane protein
LAENWLVWLGGLTLALGGAFLVKMSIDYGLLTPTVRTILGVLLGVGLAIGADRIARRELAPHGEEVGLSYVPPALAAAGAATTFASFYAAYQLYHLLSAVLAFPLLAGTPQPRSSCRYATGSSSRRSGSSARTSYRCWCTAGHRTRCRCLVI